MNDWTIRAACRTRPADWWDLGDGGNRLALMFCKGCPVAGECAAGDPEPAGIVRAGVAWTDDGKPATVCPCGYPILPHRGRPVDAGLCITCDPPKTTWIPARRRGRPRGRSGAAPGTVAAHLKTIRDLAFLGYGDDTIAAELGCSWHTVQAIRNRHQIRGRLTTPAHLRVA